MSEGLYVYAIGRAGHPLPDGAEAVDGFSRVDAIEDGALGAFYSAVDLSLYSQGVIDARASDVDWLGGIGYRHQSVMSALLHDGPILPLRAFSLFAGESVLRSLLRDHRDEYLHSLDRLDGKREWTLRV